MIASDTVPSKHLFSYAEINVYLVSLSFFDTPLLRSVVSKKDKDFALRGKSKSEGGMFYFDLEHNVKKDSSSKNTFHYLTRTAHFKNDAKHDGEVLEWVKSGNMPQWADGRPDLFWAAADKHEIARGRTSSAITIALPNGLTVQQRQDLAKDLIQEFATQHQLPYTAAIHTHKSSITGEEQPHLHLMYSERSLSDGLERLPEQFFSQYRPKNPTKGGAPKLTANALGYGKNQIQAYREVTESLINQHLKQFAPTKKLLIGGIEVEVSSLVSCLSNKEYNKKHGTQLEDVPQIARWKLYADDLPPEVVEKIEAQKEEIRQIRERNNMELYRKEYEAALKQQQEQAQQMTPPQSSPQERDPQQIAQSQLLNERQSFEQANPIDTMNSILKSDREHYYFRLCSNLFRVKGKYDFDQATAETLKFFEITSPEYSEGIGLHETQTTRRVCAATLAHIDRLASNFGSTDKLDSLKEHLQACQSKAESDRYTTLLTEAQDVVAHERRQQRKAEQSYSPNYDQTREKSNDNDYNSDMPSP